MDGRVALVATGNDTHGRVVLGPLRPYGFASLRQPDACGAGESVATENPVDAAATSAALPNTDGAALLQLPQRRHPSRNSVMAYHDNRSILLYVTVVTEKRNAILADKAVHDCIVTAWTAAADWLVGRYIIMPDHIHFFCAPATYPPLDFHQWMKRWKAQVSRTFPIGLRMGACDCPSAHGRGATGNDARGRVALVATENPADTAATSAALPLVDDTAATSAALPLVDDAAATSAALPLVDDAAATSAALPNRTGAVLPRLRLPPLFQRDCWDRQLRTGESYARKWEYVRNNPVRKGLVAHADDWPYQGQVNGLEWHERT